MNINEGLSLESAASVIARDMIKKHMATFAHVVRADRVASASVVAAYIDGLAGAMALTIAGNIASREMVVQKTVEKLIEAVDRDLAHLRRT